MGEVIRLFPDLPSEFKEGDLIWLSRFATFGTIVTIGRSGHAEIAVQGDTINLHVVRNRHEMHTAADAAFVKATSNRH